MEKKRQKIWTAIGVGIAIADGSVSLLIKNVIL